MEERIRLEYRQAAREIDRKAQEYWKNEKIKDKKWREWVRDGVKTKDEYDAWLKSQIMNGERWEHMRDTIAEDLTNADKLARSITQGYMPDVYSHSFAYGTYDLERQSGIDTSFTLYSRESLEFLFRENPQILPDPGKKVSQAIAEGKAMRWNKQHVQSVMMQAILQGNSVPDIATRLSNAVCDSNRKAAIRNARTMANGVQNAGRIDSYKRGEEMGIKNDKQWVAILDMRTRHEHRLLDGVKLPLDEKFVVEGEEIRYPCDPTASPHMVWNCRCTIISRVAGWKSMAEAHVSTEKIEDAGLDYESWKESRKEIHNPIDLPEQKREAIRAQFIRGYRGYGGPVKAGMDRTLDIDAKMEVVNKTPPPSFVPINHAYEEGGTQKGNLIITPDGYTILDKSNTARNVNEFMGGEGDGYAAKWYAGLSDAEKWAFERYTADGYQYINDYLRTGSWDSDLSEDRKNKYQKAIEDMRVAMSRYHLSTPMVFTRVGGTDLLGGAQTKEDIEKLIGAEVVDKGFTSTAVAMNRTLERSLYYMGSNNNGVLNVKYHIKVDEGDGIGVYLGTNTSNRFSENEFLFNSGSRFRVEGMYETVYAQYGSTTVKELHVNLKYLGREGEAQEPAPAETFVSKIGAIRERVAQNGLVTESDLKEAGGILSSEYYTHRKADIDKLEGLQKRLEEWKEANGAKQYEKVIFDEEGVGYSFDEIRNAQRALNNLHNTPQYKELVKQIQDMEEVCKGDTRENADWLRSKLSEVREVGTKGFDMKTHLPSSPARQFVADAYELYPKDWVKESVDFSPIKTGFRERGYYSSYNNEIMLSEGTSDDRAFAIAIHELGHRFEDMVKGIVPVEKEFYDRRTAGESLEWLGGLFRKDEEARKDDFLNPYMGKDYGGSFYELVSLGFQYAYTEPYTLRGDTDMESWIYGVLCLL